MHRSQGAAAELTGIFLIFLFFSFVTVSSMTSVAWVSRCLRRQAAADRHFSELPNLQEKPPKQPNRQEKPLQIMVSHLSRAVCCGFILLLTSA